MREPDTRVAELRESITSEASKAIGIKPASLQEKIFRMFFWPPAQRFARLVASLDDHIEQDGLTEAMRWLLPRFASQVEVNGAENIPSTGPVLVVSNHPGAFDGVVILAQFQRNDIKLIISDVPFTRGLSAGSRHMIFSTGDDMHERMGAVRQSIRHLQSGGVLMLYPTGLVDPDPSFMPGADQALGEWSPSLELFLRKVPETQILPTIISGVIAPKYMNNIFARRQKTVRNQQKVAEYFEIVQLMVVQRDLGLSPRVSFGKPLTPADFSGPCESVGVLECIIDRARGLLAEHIAAA